ncbi:MAG: FKBP-type peptidyl-prolyl cis-trans isomerase [Armatimonadota bacterium]|jgi:FKBP-type peptidyl-prolyl cis-trans isomerase
MPTTISGVLYEDKQAGEGPAVQSGDEVAVHYSGWLDDGTQFDTSKQPGRGPFSFKVGAGRVIQGWEEGVVGMQKGSIRELTIPADMGYGARAIGPIPANSTLHFEIELIEIT